jgi:hypothetical protein
MASTLQVDGISTFTGQITANGGMEFIDNKKLTFGTGDDLEIYHDGNNSYINDVGTGNILIRGANVLLTTGGGTKYLEGGSNVLTLFHTGNERLRTSSVGVYVTGTVTASGTSVFDALDISGNVDVGGTLDVSGDITVSGTVDGRDIAADGTKLNTIETGATADQTAAEIKALLVDGLTATHLAAGSVGASEIGNDVVNSQHYADNSIDALHLNVSGNGTTSQYLRSDGDGTMSWVTPPNTTYSVGDGGLSQINFTSADHAKLNGIEAGATADQTSVSGSSGSCTGNAATATALTAGNKVIQGALTVGNTTSSDIYMTDTDHGDRRIHCNSNNIGFLSSTNAWGAYCTDAGLWMCDSGVYSTAANNTFGYLTMTDGIRVEGTGITYPGATAAGGSANRIGFRWVSPHIKATISNSTVITVGTASDYRIKDTITNDIGDALSMLESLPTYNFYSKGEESKTVYTGVLAHELESIIPSLVTGEKDHPTQLQSVDYAGLTPFLIQALKQVTARLRAVEALLEIEPAELVVEDFVKVESPDFDWPEEEPDVGIPAAEEQTKENN